VARDERRTRAATRGGGRGSPGGGSALSTRNITIAAVAVGVLIVAIVAAGQLGNKVSGTFKDPGMQYPAALLDGNAIGKAGAPVTMDVYEDFQCPYCGQYALSVEPVLVNKYVTSGQVRIVHHDFVFLDRAQGDYESRLAATGAYCANQQGKYWEYAHWVYNNQDGENQGGFRRDRLTAIAVAAGLDEQKLSTCLDSPDAAAYVNAATTKATSLPVKGTPAFWINGTEWNAKTLSVADIESGITAALAKSSASPSPAASASPAPSSSTAP
jgi:protein-disulfide isomerase